MRPLRILFVVKSYAPDVSGGAARSTQTLAEALQRRGHDVHVARLVPAGTEAAHAAAAAQAGVTGEGRPAVHFAPLRNLYYPSDQHRRGALWRAAWHYIDLHNPLAARDFRALVARIQPDVVNTSVISGFSTSIFKAAKSGGAVLVHTLRDYYLACGKSGMFKNGSNCQSVCAACKPFKAVRSIDTRQVDLVLSNSDYVARRHKAVGVFGDDKPCLTQLNINEPPPGAWARSRRPGPLVFGFIGRLSPEKGVETLIRAVRALPADAPEWRLDLAGDGGEGFVRRLKDQCADEPRIRFLGWSRPADFYPAADVLACPSTYEEPLPRVIYEGYGYGLPSIASDSGGIPEILTPGREGFLYEAGKPEQLTALMLKMLTLPAADYAAMSARALAKAADFSGPVVAATYEGRLRQLLQDAGRADA